MLGEKNEIIIIRRRRRALGKKTEKARKNSITHSGVGTAWVIDDSYGWQHNISCSERYEFGIEAAVVSSFQ